MLKDAIISAMASPLSTSPVSYTHLASIERNGEYPAWEYQKDSPLRAKMMRIYEEMFGKIPTVEVIHAGLECGILSTKIPNLDCVSIGPNIYEIHTTEEHMSISSVQRMWNYLVEIVKTK